ncbi:MAG: TonB-dependent receptor plug domain-containing protein [Bacteroidia bacterium]|nr:TonB-dependent receptor plug domain-containing protein [Bacteroidia bacterium]
MRILYVIVCGFLLLPSFLQAQTSISVSGVIRNKESGETIIGASVAAPAQKRGVYSNEYGFYSLSLAYSQDSLELRISLPGFRTESRKVLPVKAVKLDVDLSVASLSEVVIEAEGVAQQVNSTQMSVERITMTEARKIPALFGEVDIIKTLQLKPGVTSGSEGSSGIFVRGGGPDQNLVLLDNTVVYNPSHLFGFFSTFNSDAVKDVKLYKGGFPAQYGGRLSSVIDVKMNEGNRKQFSGSGGLGLITSRLTLEGPLRLSRPEDGRPARASYIVSGRRTYVDVFTRLINEAQQDNENFNEIPDYFFYDFNAKVNYQLSDKDQLFLSGYFGRDKFAFNDNDFDFNFNWGNANATLRWNHLFSPKLFLNTSASVADYEYIIRNRFDIFSFSIGSRITDGGLRTDFTWLPDPRHTVRFGAQGTYHRFIVGRLDAGAADSSFSFNAGDKYYGTELGAYIEDDIEISERVSLNAGLRLSAFRTDSAWYFNPEPRAALKVSLTKRVSFKASYARMVQYLHLVANSANSLPTDVWYPSTSGVPPQGSHQVAGGITVGLGDEWIVSNEVYYKWLQNQIDFRDGANLFVNTDLESEFVFGRGWTYGNEFYIERTQGQVTGWVGYTLAWAWRQFDGTVNTGGEENPGIINSGSRFHPRNDARHTVNVVLIYDISRRLSLSSAWDYRSGNAITLPVGRFWGFGPDFLTNSGSIPLQIPDYPARNSFRMPAYHRMDVGLVIRFFPKWGEADLNISAYNAYNRRNPYFIFFEPQLNADNIPIGNKAKQVALFPIIPSVTFNFKF